MTTTLEDIAFNNLKFLNDKEDFLANRYTLKKQQLIKEDDDTVYTLTDLEYPLFFTFHQLINHVQKKGRSLQISPKDLRNDWKGIEWVPKSRNNRKRGGRK